MEIFFTQQVAEELAGAVKDEIQATYGCVVTEFCPHVPEHGTGGYVITIEPGAAPLQHLEFYQGLDYVDFDKKQVKGFVAASKLKVLKEWYLRKIDGGH